MEDILKGGTCQILGGVALVLGAVIIICNLVGLWNEFSSIGMWFYRNSTLTYGCSTLMMTVGGFFYFKKY